MDYRNADTPPILRDFLAYHETIRGHSKNTVDEYYLDLRTFFRYLKVLRGVVPRGAGLEDIPIADVDLKFVAAVTLAEVYEYLGYLSREREKNQHSRNSAVGLSATSRARKVATLRSYYRYLTSKAKLLSENPVAELDTPKIQKSLPRYLTLEESRHLLSAVDGKNRERDYCILCIFLNCGLRISEIVGMNLQSVRPDHLRVLGKGNKERIVYLNPATREAIDRYLDVRRGITGVSDRDALFLSARKQRMSRETVHAMVKNSLLKAGLDRDKYSAHKLRHTAATLMLQNGVDVRTLQEVLGHENLNTTQIYTHVGSASLKSAAMSNPLGEFEVEKKAERK
ncbi:MAG: tyrosine recombinase XerC [Firmicutes bacterium]|nr:tyrosine recombinase XerC [Bacillota bacterium]